MPNKRTFVVFLAIIACVLFPATAQENLLANPGFETEGDWTPVASGGGGVFGAPPNWGGWFDSSSATVPNGFPHIRIFVDDDATEEEIGVANGSNLFIHGGNRSANFGRGSGTFTGSIYQQATVEEGANVQGSAWVIMNLPGGANMQARVGIDPNGGTNPGDTDIVWSDWAQNQIGAYRQLRANATATGTTVTLFLYFRSLAPVDPNGIYWDSASLTVGGPGGSAGGTPGEAAPGSTPVPTAPPVAAFVVPQGAQQDGSIVHTVVAGDTLNAISVAYGVPPDEILALNNLSDGRLLRIGQQLLIQPASEEAEPEPTAADEAEPTEAPAETEEETPEEAPVETEETQPTVVAQAPTEQPEEQVTEEVTATEEVQPTVEPTTAATPTDAPPAPVSEADTEEDLDPTNLTTSICATLYEDANANRLQEDEEVLLAEGEISLLQNGTPVESQPTAGETLCFEDLQPGEYVVSAAPPSGYGSTTPNQRLVNLQPGSTVSVSFGAAPGVEVAMPPPSDLGDLQEETVTAETVTEDEDAPLAQYLGLLLFGLAGLTLLGGIGATLLLRRR